MSAGGPVAGVDFGTCWSSVVVRRRDGSTVRVKDPNRGVLVSLASAVAEGPSGELVFGGAAEGLRRYRPYASEFKRRLGDTAISVGARQFTPVELVGAYLGWLRDLASGMAGEDVASAVVTVPASYEGYLRGLMEEAAAVAGFVDVELVSEPVAAARHALADRPAAAGEHLLVYDLGGGTFDVAVVEVGGDGEVEVLAADGQPDVGGIHFDRIITEEVRSDPDAEMLNAVLAGGDTEADKMELEMASMARDFKEQLSFVASHQTPVPPTGFFYELSQAAFAEMIGPMLAETLACCDRAIEDAGMDWHDLDRVVLVGGSTRIPAVADLLAARNPKAVQRVADPELAVAEGAAAPVVAPPDRVDRYLEQHAIGSVVTGTIVEHHDDRLIVDLGVSLGSARAELPRPDSLVNLGIGTRRKVEVNGRTDGGQLSLKLPAAKERTSSFASEKAKGSTSGPTLAQRLVAERIAAENDANPPGTTTSATRAKPEVDQGRSVRDSNDHKQELAAQPSVAAEHVLDQQSISTAGIPLGTLVLTNKRLMVTKPSARVALASPDPLGAREILYERSVGDIVDVAKSIGAFTITFRDGERRRFQLLASGMIDRGAWVKMIKSAAATFTP